MAYIIGTDEAGYGPNLGPLVIAATAWRVDESPGTAPWQRAWDFLAGRWAESPSPLFGDSKALYVSGGDWAGLERGLFAALGELPAARAAVGAGPDQLGPVPLGPVPSGPLQSWRSLLTLLAPACLAEVDDQPWYAPFDLSLPRDVDAATLDAAGRELTTLLASTGVHLAGLRLQVVFPATFNAQVAKCGSKGTALSLWTLELARDLIQEVDEEIIFVHCDKHGGRNRYAALLQTVFPESWIEVQEESRQRSLYRWDLPPRRFEAQFAAKGERFLPSALASMAAKYVREVAMCAWNQFWQQQIPGLRPTAGYPVDARRFAEEIRATQQKLGIADDLIWRER